MQNMNISVKLLGGFFVVALFAAIVGGIGIINIRAIDAAARDVILAKPCLVADHDDSLIVSANGISPNTLKNALEPAAAG